MRKNFTYTGAAVLIAGALTMATGCGKDWLVPKPLSFYEPDETFVDAAAMRAGLVACARNARIEYYGDNPPILTEMLFSEVTVEGTTDKSGPAQDLNLLITPDGANQNSADRARIYHYWSEGYKGIKYANTIISRIDNAKYANTAERNAILGSAYFHRALRYYRLCMQFGDVPAPMKEIISPRTDFNSTKRDVILEYIKKDLDSAKDWVTDNVARGEVTKGAVLHLLTKVNLALGKFDDAIASASAVIDGGAYSLMRQPFGATKKNVIWDLHRPENKSIGENREGIFLVIDRFGDGGYDGGMRIMRQAVPFWGTNVSTPSGKKGTNDNVNPEFIQSNLYGRGIGRCRPTPYSLYEIWNDPNDLRHAKGNWMNMEDLVYNDMGLKNSNDPWYLKNLQLRNAAGGILCTDTIRCWFGWPHYKIFVPDTENSPMQGGHSDWYIFRLAETYLLRAEAYYWKGQSGPAIADLDQVRTRAGCAPFTGTLDIGTILDERARELFFEEPRKTELTRMSIIFARTGKAAPNGKTYTMDRLSDDNFFYDRVIAKNDFYRLGIVTNHGDKFTISPYHIFWPVPAKSIQANVHGVINQNKGYVGTERNEPAKDVVDTKAD
ncbi:RagB/SusD family nutrient uptake outer membrane protein [Chitinophaga rhizosphaerae]|uniref:RagB/SusD family nutrient uptake outer membrane protein n=1 Tax=Chitinophaga rhizosphaerae TaxID=1864947 RepID=UPI000F8085C7|nr:RagB/SusD family nutrient uptake outer membrane protein [Chitinophaga rhizosphaerae]